VFHFIANLLLYIYIIYNQFWFPLGYFPFVDAVYNCIPELRYYLSSVPAPYLINPSLNNILLKLDLGTHLFAKSPRPGDSEVAFLSASQAATATTSLATQR